MISKPLFFAALLGLASSPAYAASCNKDACLKTVNMGHRVGGPGACKAFLRATVTPRTVIKTTTVTLLNTVTDTTTHVDYISTTLTIPYETTVSTEIDTSMATYSYQKRTATNTPVTNSPTAVPKYAAQACTDTAEYSSACSCVGATKTTITAAAPTSTKTITKHRTITHVHTHLETSSVVSTTTSTDSITTTTTTTTYATNTAYPTSCSDPASFLIQVSDGPAAYIGQYAIGDLKENGYITFGTLDQATTFTRDASCTLESDDFLLNTTGDESFDNVYFNSQGVISNNGYDVIKFYIFSDGTGTIAVNTPDNTADPTLLQVQTTSGVLQIGTDIYTDNGDAAVTLVAVAVTQ